MAFPVHSFLLIAATLFEATQNGVAVKIESETKAVDPAKSVFVDIEVASPRGTAVQMPDLRDRAVGFSLAEDFAEEPETVADGSLVQRAKWRLVPEPCADVYKIRPFAVGGMVAGPVYFDPPPPREPVTGGMECDPKKDLPPLSWKLAGWCLLALLGVAALVAAVWFPLRYLARRIKEHRMSPIERAWAELDRLLRKGLPGRGRYKDFYVELTMVVRRYVQRKYGIRAPHLTTEEFLSQFRADGGGRRDELAKFLESADMVKFAGVEATPEMADAATGSARSYLKSDSAEEAAK